MDTFDLSTVTGLALGGTLLFLPAWAWARRRRRVALRSGAAQVKVAAADPGAQARLAALEEVQGDLRTRVDLLAEEAGRPEERLKAISGQLLTVIRERNAGLDAAVAGLEDLRARVKAIEAGGDRSAVREILDALAVRIDGIEARGSAAASGGAVQGPVLPAATVLDMAALQERLDALEASGGSPFAEISDQLTRLYAQKDAGLEAVLQRFAPLEARLAQLEGGAGTGSGEDDGAGVQFAARLAELQQSQAEVLADLAALRSGEADGAEVSARLEALQEQRDALTQNTLERLSRLEREHAARDPQAAFDGFAARLESLREAHAAGVNRLEGRVAALEAPDESPFVEISEQLTRLYAQKDATVETVFTRLAPLEAKLAQLERELAARDPQAALERMEARLGGLQEVQAEGAADLGARLDSLAAALGQTDGAVAALRAEAGAVAGIGARLDRLQQQRDAAAGATAARFEALERDVAARDPKEMLDRFAERLEALREAHVAGSAALDRRLAVLEAPGENPFAEISTQLTKLYAQKDATVETVFARLAPLEAKLGAVEKDLAGIRPATQAQLDGLAGRVDALDWAQNEVAERIGTLQDGLAAAERDLAARDPQAALDGFAERIAALQAQRDTLVEDTLERMAALERQVSEQDPKVALDRFAERLEAMRAASLAGAAALDSRISVLENPGENPFAEISEQLTKLYAQKDATVETVFARLAPLEAKLGEIEEALSDRDPQAALDRFAERLEALREAHAAGSAALDRRLAMLEAPGESPFAEISDQLTRLYAQKDATVETVFARLAPLEGKLLEMERDLAARDPQAALERFGARLDLLSEAAQATDGTLEALRAETGAAAEISARLERLQDRSGALAEATAARLGELERDVAARDPREMLDRFAERLEELRVTQATVAATVEGRLAALENPDGDPFAEISDQLAQLQAQKDATEETVFARLAPLEEKLQELEQGLAGIGSATEARFDGLGSRIEAFDVVVDRVAALDALETRVGALDGLAGRIDALGWAQDELGERLAGLHGEIGSFAGPFAELSQDLTRLYAQKDESLEAMIARLAPIEDRLASLEEHPWDPDVDEARAQAQAIAAQMIAARAAAEHTELFADRLALLEASLPRLSATQTDLMTALERGVLEARAGIPARAPAPQVTARTAGAEDATAEDMTEVWSMPQLVSLHRK